jgi:quinol monooxygenase YgiN
MWAQLIKMRLKPGKDLAGLDEQMRAIEQPDSGLLRSIVMLDQKDPGQFYVLVVFESEEKARARERDPRRQEGLQASQAMMADMLAGPPEFVDLAVVEEWTG